MEGIRFTSSQRWQWLDGSSKFALQCVIRDTCNYYENTSCTAVYKQCFFSVSVHRGIIALFGSWGLQATKLWNLWNLSHFTYTSLPTEGKRCNTSSVAGAYSDLAIAEYFESYRL